MLRRTAVVSLGCSTGLDPYRLVASPGRKTRYCWLGLHTCGGSPSTRHAGSPSGTVPVRAEVIIIELDADPALYSKVNKTLGLDPTERTGDWPKGLLAHVGGGGDGKVVVVEVWESRADQESFMTSRLGPALGQAGAPEPKRMEWLSLLGNINP